ncbi:MAG: Y-family DNA polymerase [Pyrinomonadaceae bacterium]
MPDRSAIALVDCNNFFVSCERAVNADLQKRPVVVLSNNDGCVISRSNSVKALGVPMAAPLFQVRDLLEKHNTAIISCNHALYREFAEQIVDILIEDLGDNVLELYSIDEAFLDVGTPDKLKLLGTHIKNKIAEKTKIPVSVGFAETKTLAKLANGIAKKSLKTEGVLDLYNSPYTDLALKRTDVNDIWGVGSRSTAHLRKHGINTAFELKNADPEKVRSYLNVFGARTVMELNGIKCIPLEITKRDNKSIAHTRTFGSTISNFGEVKNAVFYFTTRALEKMRWNDLTTKNLTVYLQTDRFNPVPYYYSNAHSYNSVYYSDITSEIYAWARLCLDRIYIPGMQYKRAGVVLSELTPAASISKRLYCQPDFERWHRLNKSIDELNLRYGRDIIRLAALYDNGTWQSQSTHRGNDSNHSIERERLGLGKKFSRPVRFL